MKLVFPNITQSNFEYAFECLEDCKKPHAKDFGFNYPYFAPGGQYGKQWWQLDSALALSGYKWHDRSFAETALLNFIESQKPDGRICLYGNDVVPKGAPDNFFPKQNEDISSLPKIFDVAYHILQATNNTELIEKTYCMLKKYIGWWYTDRFDSETGLFSSVFEETFIPYLGSAMEYAAVDTNVEVYVGLVYTAKIAERLNKTEDVAELEARAESLKNAIDSVLWWEEKGAYYPYSLPEKKHVDCLMASTFYPLRLNIASDSHKEKLLLLLKDNEHFNWDKIPLTSVSMKDPVFQTTEGAYKQNPSWSGNVWTLINEMVVRGLLDSGENELAAELALKTVYAFNNNCSEFINPFDGSGHGVLKYAWTASQYIELIIEVIFGVGLNGFTKNISVNPNLTGALKQAKLSITELMFFDGVYLDVTIENGEVSYKIKQSNS